MSRLGEDLCGALPYRTEPRSRPRLSLYHLKLTDSALRCLRDLQRGQILVEFILVIKGNPCFVKPLAVSGVILGSASSSKSIMERSRRERFKIMCAFLAVCLCGLYVSFFFGGCSGRGKRVDASYANSIDNRAKEELLEDWSLEGETWNKCIRGTSDGKRALAIGVPKQKYRKSKHLNFHLQNDTFYLSLPPKECSVMKINIDFRNNLLLASDMIVQKASGTSLPQPVITFQGNQGYIKIPTPGSEDRLQIFSFYLSRESKDKPQSSFECIRQGTSWSGEKQLSCVGSIQDKITICATDESYQLTRDRMSQVEKETWSRAAIEIKPGATYRSKCVKIPNKNTEPAKDASSCNRRPAVFLTPAAKKCNRMNGEQRSLQEWLIHLLAIKPHRKQDLILRLEKARALPREQTELLSTLDMVGRLSPKDGSYSLREELYRHVQRDWMGYTPEEKQHIAEFLSRKHLNVSASQNRLSMNQSSTFHPNTRVRPPEAKRSAPPEPAENENCKRRKSSDSSTPRKGEKYSCSPPAKNTNSVNVNSPDSSLCSVSENQGMFPRERHLNQDAHRTVCKVLHKEKQREKSHGTPDGDKAKKREATSQGHKRPDRCKERKNEQDSSDEEDEDDDDWEEEALLLERCLCYPEEKQQFLESTPASEEAPDYVKKYSTITTQEQQNMYEEDFTSDYTEYLELHAKIGKVLDRFVYLGSKMKKLKPGTGEHKVIENKILAEYNKFKKTYPGYREEKARCEYLHHKLSHIKYLILEYEKTKPT